MEGTIMVAVFIFTTHFHVTLGCAGFGFNARIDVWQEYKQELVFSLP